MDIQYLLREEIDTLKWDECISRSANGLIYSLSTYLDSMATHWNGIVIGDYQAVMALPWRKKWSVAYHYCPAFIQQLGVVGELTADDLPQIIKTITARVGYGDLHFNFENCCAREIFEAKPLVNMVLPLAAEYPAIAAKYTADVRTNIKKASRERLMYAASDDISEPVQLFREQYGERMGSVSGDDYQRFSELCELLLKMNMVFIRKVQSVEGNVLAIALFLNDGRRIYNIMNSTTPAGRKKEANHFLIDRVIREFPGSSLILDMEGSELEGVKNFYRKFGCINQPYFYFHYNKLPWIVRIFKR